MECIIHAEEKKKMALSRISRLPTSLQQECSYKTYIQTYKTYKQTCKPYKIYKSYKQTYETYKIYKSYKTYTTLQTYNLQIPTYLPYLHYKHATAQCTRVWPLIEYYVLRCLLMNFLELDFESLLKKEGVWSSPHKLQCWQIAQLLLSTERSKRNDHRLRFGIEEMTLQMQ